MVDSGHWGMGPDRDPLHDPEAAEDGSEAI